MEAQTDITTYLEQGKQALAQGRGRDAAIAYAHAAQIEPNNPLVHLGLAEANLALGDNGVVLMACRRTQELAPSGPAYHLAQALSYLLDRRYLQALEQVDTTIQDDPGNAYAHALRAYLLRATNQTYDAGLARARASRLSIGGTFENCFPPLEPLYSNGYQNQPTAFTPPLASPAPQPEPVPASPRQQEPFQTWTRTPQQRQVIRARFWLSQRPRFITYILMGLTLAGFLFYFLVSQVPAAADLLASGFGRIVLATFIPYGPLGLIFNLLSLFFIGSTVELLYGKWRYVLIYLLAGTIGNLTLYLLAPGFLFLGASNAIFGIIGAEGAFFLVNRRALGPVANSMLIQWGIWLAIILVFSISDGITLPALFASLGTGLILGIILIPSLRRRTRGRIL